MGTLSLDADKCLADLNSGLLQKQTRDNRSIGLDNFGNPLYNDAHATAISYADCLTFCGNGPEEFVWSIFTEQVAAWLLPWLALVSQLPYGAGNKVDNLISMLLAVGSPTLAAYSLFLTSLNGSYVASRFAGITYPNAHHAVRLLAGLQQVPLRISDDDGQLASLVVLPANDKWWSTIRRKIDHEHTWSIPAFASIAWVVIAYLLTVISAFTAIGDTDTESDGPANGSLWIWVIICNYIVGRSFNVNRF